MDVNLIILLYVVFVAGFSYSLQFSVYPMIASNKGLNESEIGFIISLYCVGNLIGIPFNNKIISLIKRFNVLALAISFRVSSLINSYILQDNFFNCLFYGLLYRQQRII